MDNSTPKPASDSGQTADMQNVNQASQPVQPPVNTTFAADKVSGNRPTQPPPLQSVVEKTMNAQDSLLNQQAIKQEEPVVSAIPISPEPGLHQGVGGPANKEHEPRPTPMPDVAKMSDQEIVEEEKVVEAEIEKMVEQSSMDKKPNIPKDVQSIGVELAAEAIPMPSIPSGYVKPPMTLNEAIKMKRKSRIRDSVKWLSALIIYHWKKLRAKPDDSGGSAFG